MKAKVRSRLSILTIAALLFTLSILASYAQSNFGIDWFTIDGSSSVASGDVYSLAGTAGQPDGGVFSGGQYKIESGFWGLTTPVQNPGPPLLSLSLTSTNTILISWPYPSAGFSIQQSLTLSTVNWGPLGELPLRVGNEWQLNISTPAGNRFYRLYRP